MNDDLSRGLLKFGRSRKLGARGFRWLKIHLANMYGYDKASLDDRAAFADKHMADILDSADKPLEVSLDYECSSRFTYSFEIGSTLVVQSRGALAMSGCLP